MNKSSKSLWLTLGAAGALSFLYLQQRSMEERVPQLDAWMEAMSAYRSQKDMQRIANRVRTRYAALLAHCPNLSDRALRTHLEIILLPGLALYQMLKDDHKDRAAALNEVESLFRYATFKRLSALRLINQTPFSAFRYLLRWTMYFGFPQQGWKINWRAFDHQKARFDIHSCFFKEQLTAFGAPELTPLFCRIDDFMAEMISDTIRFSRTKTIAQGAECCDFQYLAVERERGRRPAAR